MLHFPIRARLRRGIAVTALTALLATVAGTAPVAASDRPWLDPSLPPEARARLLVAAMTLEEKSAVLYGYGTRVVGDQTWQVHVRGNDRLGIPDLVQGDTPSGIMLGTNAVTQLPASVALAATFSRQDAYLYGDVLGGEARATGYGVLHGPNVDVLRDPRTAGAESYGEDPYLVGEIGTEYVRGVQSNRIIADAKHFAVNTQEANRTQIDARIDRRTLQELYLAPFQSVVQDGNVGMVMCAYNKINGTQACDSQYLLDQVLRRRWGFDGIVRTDAGAVHALESLLIGLDQEFRSESQFGQKLIAAVRAGTFPESAVDETVRRIMRTMMEYGIFDHPPQRTGADLAGNAEQARRLAEDATVLLRNEHDLLPLDAHGTDRIAVIGTNVNDPLTAGGPANSAPQGKDTILQAIRDRLPGATVDHQPGVDPIYPIALLPGHPQLPSGALTADDGRTRGATGSYHAADGSLILSRTDTCLCAAPGNMFVSSVSAPQPVPAGTASITWHATLTVDRTGSHGFDLAAGGTARLYLDGTLRGQATDSTQRAEAVTVPLSRGTHDLRVEYTPTDATSQLKVGWSAPAGALDANLRAAVDAARRADVAVVVVRDLETESTDRPSLTLPNDQDRLIRAVAAANRRTVVVLNTGAAVAMPWNDDVPAIVQSWYGGTRAGAALARVLFGDVNPSGRLPISIPRSDADLPTHTVEQFPGVDLTAQFSEGINTGYRYHNAERTPDARYPFGYGLSYTSFRYSGLRLDRDTFHAGTAGPDGSLRGQPAVRATFTVRNTGRRAGAVVPQLYVEFPAQAGMPAPLLKGFDRIYLKPGQGRTVTLTLDQRAFSTYDPGADRWTVPTGQFRLRIGDSSTDTGLTGRVGAIP
jgi:beta-glucosidase